ncbi:hypothetical protein [Soonwooa sp.]|uniref:hypothetical protein n=1 Tax=Soonwooa sp. TaxID=1938592 RepID=UPI0026290B41|nr:hypothetical protein [Soonwooa sp.]
MNQYKYFSQEGSSYSFKPQYIVKSAIVLMLIGLCWVFWKVDIKWMVAVFALLSVMIIITLFTDKFQIDTNHKVINLRQGIYMQSREVPFDKIITFEMLTTTTNFIRSSVVLNLYYLNDKGKEKVMKVAQGISKTHMQNILNEVDEIMGRE